MRTIYIIIIGLVVSICSYAQNSAGEVLREIERNNPSLKAAAARVEADRLANKSEALLDNPEVEFNYLWGADNIGGRHDVRVSQPLDIATISGMRSGKVASMNELAALEYKAARQEILLEAKLLCVDLVHTNATLEDLRTHLDQSKTLVEAYEKRMKAGEATVLDLNKARIHLTSVQGQVNNAEAERSELLSRLRSLNGGEEIAFNASSYNLGENLPDDFETWMAEASAQSPMLEYVRQEVQLRQKQLSIDKASRLPELAVGYMSEIRTAEKFRGVTLGVNIPLWNGANKVKRARAEVAAAESRQAAAEEEFHNDLQRQYAKALSMKENSEMMRSALKDTDSREYLLSALTKGEISMIDYLVENDLYYEVLEQTLEAECAYRRTLAYLNSYKL